MPFAAREVNVAMFFILHAQGSRVILASGDRRSLAVTVGPALPTPNFGLQPNSAVFVPRSTTVVYMPYVNKYHFMRHNT